MNDTSVDVVIVGSGIAGLQCALRLAELDRDLKIAVVESRETIGGSANWAVGSFTAGGTRWQQAAGVSDGPEEHFGDLLQMCQLGSVSYRDHLGDMCQAAAEIMHELADRGVVFAGPFLEPPHQKPRMHNVVPGTMSLVAVLADAIAAHDHVEIRTNWEVVNLQRSSGGGFSLSNGVESIHTAALVIASGDTSAADAKVPSINPGLAGVPIRLAAAEFGADVPPPPAVTAGLRTTRAGGPYVAPTDDVVSRGDVVAEGLSIPGEKFLAEQTSYTGIDLFLELGRADGPDDLVVCTYPAIGFGRLSDLERDGLAQISAETVRIGPMRVVVTLTDGGLNVDRGMRVLQPAGHPIPSLYACGTAALGASLVGGHGHHLLWAATSGHIAASSIVSSLRSSRP